MKIAFLTSGGIAPCLSASIGRLTENYLKNYPNAEKIGRETVSIPLSPALKKLEVNKIIQSIKKIFGKYKSVLK